MEEEQKIMKINNLLYVGRLPDDSDKSPATHTASSHASSFRSRLTKQYSQRGSCLCSPTTHAGSFRCRYHRSSGLSGRRRGSLSIGSGLSELDKESVKIALSNITNPTSNGTTASVGERG